ncbi:MAG TPA: hypothetical protein VLF18_10295, partial [Tahibacter sp.]|uniref:hypothetical protein n=1 Tax=Tahibacter sp. TaxID=2056211 RepID=UPI002BC45C40
LHGWPLNQSNDAHYCTQSAEYLSATVTSSILAEEFCPATLVVRMPHVHPPAAGASISAMRRGDRLQYPAIAFSCHSHSKPYRKITSGIESDSMRRCRRSGCFTGVSARRWRRSSAPGRPRSRVVAGAERGTEVVAETHRPHVHMGWKGRYGHAGLRIATHDRRHAAAAVRRKLQVVAEIRASNRRVDEHAIAIVLPAPLTVSARAAITSARCTGTVWAPLAENSIVFGPAAVAPSLP